MGDRLYEFVAEEAWLFVAVVTLPVGVLFALPGLEGVTAAVFMIGWFLLVPILLFWGEEVADLLVGERGDDVAAAVDPVTELQARYARGEIDEEEFDRRLSMLLESDMMLSEGVHEASEPAREPDRN